MTGFSDLTIVTTTLYRDDDLSYVRAALSKKLFGNAAELGIRCVVVDGGSRPDYLAEIQNLDNLTVCIDSSLGMGESRRQALGLALRYSGNYFLWVEPEKDDLISQSNLEPLIQVVRNGCADIVVPRRDEMQTLPKFQAWIERRANKRASRLMDGHEYDLWFGPKLFNRHGARYFAEYVGNLDKWDSIIKPVVNAYRAGQRVASVEVSYRYDPTQAQAEEEDRSIKWKRLDQYSQILAELGDPYWREAK